jgi:triacylglycerol lipase
MITRFSSLAPRRKILVAGAALLVLAAAAAAAVAAAGAGGGPAIGGSASSHGPRQNQPGPVLLIPGYGGSTQSLSVLAARIRASGRQATVVSLPGNGTGSLIQDATVLDAAAARALRGGAPSVDVVGYSAGGVAALVWARAWPRWCGRGTTAEAGRHGG